MSLVKDCSFKRKSKFARQEAPAFRPSKKSDTASLSIATAQPSSPPQSAKRPASRRRRSGVNRCASGNPACCATRL